MKKFPTEKSLSSKTKSLNCYFSSSTKAQDNKSNTTKPNIEAINRYKRLCIKTSSIPQHSFLTNLKGENLNIYLDNYSLIDVQNINKIIGAFFYFKQIIFAPFDIRACLSGSNQNNFHSKSKVLTNSEKILEEKEKRDRENEKIAKMYSIVQGIAKNLCLSESVKVFKIYNFELKTELCEFLCEGILNNKSLTNLIINNSQFTNESFEVLVKGVLTHEGIEYLDLSNNSLDDKCGNMLSRIIIRQTQRRDQVIWLHGLRNERPLNNDYTRGLISLNLSNNQLADSTAEDISYAISYDSYIRSIDLKNNLISQEGCKKFVNVLRKNLTILNLDLRGNYGYGHIENNMHKRLVIKLAKNIKHLQKQLMDGELDKWEFGYFKNFVNYEFFNVEVPQHIIEIYNNSNSHVNSKADLRDILNTNEDAKHEEINKEKNSCLKGKYLKKGVRGKNLLNDPNLVRNNDPEDQVEHNFNSNPVKGINNYEDDDEDNSKCESEEAYVEETLNEEENLEDSLIYKGYNTDTEVDPLKTRANKKYVLYIDKLKSQNRNTFYENLKLRKQILAMRAQLLQNTVLKANSAQNNHQILNNNSNNAFYAEDINNPITQNLSLTGTNNNLNISNNQRVTPVTGDEASYENYYNRIENLFSELTRLMDNMENNIRRNEN